EGREFLACTDTWYRPTTIYYGSHADLYAIEMDLQHLEPPVSIPDDLQAGMDFANAKELGRIYRINPTQGEKRDLNNINLGSQTSAELVEDLGHPNQWWRLTAQRLILERQDKSIVPALKEQFTNHPDPRGRLHSFYALDGL